jgi:hypothetical protein
LFGFPIFLSAWMAKNGKETKWNTINYNETLLHYYISGVCEQPTFLNIFCWMKSDLKAEDCQESCHEEHFVWWLGEEWEWLPSSPHVRNESRSLSRTTWSSLLLGRTQQQEGIIENLIQTPSQPIF